jgi:hypothetical protein
MRRAILPAVLLLALQSGAATASDNWQIYKGKAASWGYDAGALGRGPRSGPLNAMYATYRLNADTLDGTVYHYAVTTAVFSCSARTTRVTQIALYDNDGAQIDKLAANSEAPATPIDGNDADQISKILFAIGCKGDPAPGGAVAGGDFESALQKMKP